MKVLHVEAGRHLYGGAQQVVYLVEGLAKLGVESILACPRGSAVARVCRAHAEIEELPMSGDVDPLLVPRLARLARRHQVDLLHAHSRRGADLYTGWAARLAGRPAVLSRRVDNTEASWLARFRAAPYAQVIAISEGIRRVQAKLGVPAERLRVVRSAVDPADYLQPVDRQAYRRQLGLGSDAVLVGMAAQMIHRKGHDILMQALESVLPSWLQLQVLLFGQGPLLESLLADIQARAWQERVRFMGFVDPIAPHLAALDALVHPARTEGLGVVLLQAACAGLPVVACRAGGMPEAVVHEQTGLLLPIEDSAALAAALFRLRDEPAVWQAWGAAGRERMLREFSIDAMAKQTLAVYQEVLRVDS